MRGPGEAVRKAAEDHLLEAAAAFESAAYPHATPETLRLLVHCRGAIRKFLASGLGRADPAGDV